MVLRYEFFLELPKDDGSFEQAGRTLRSGSELAAKGRLENMIKELAPADFQGVVEEGRYVPDPDDSREVVFEQSGRSWLVRPQGDTIEWVGDFVPEDVERWAQKKI